LEDDTARHVQLRFARPEYVQVLRVEADGHRLRALAIPALAKPEDSLAWCCHMRIHRPAIPLGNNEFASCLD
jgi:hypothetical protein